MDKCASHWAPNVVLADADFIDRVAFDLIVNFERMLGRRIPPADLCRWLDCIALDGGLRPGDNAVQAVFIHDKERRRLDNFAPADFSADLDGKAFKDNLGEFTLHAFDVEPIVSKADFFVQAFEDIAASEAVQRIMVVADMERYGNAVKACAATHHGKDITLFAMEPLTGRGFTQEILGYSLMSALGISGDELQ